MIHSVGLVSCTIADMRRPPVESPARQGPKRLLWGCGSNRWLGPEIAKVSPGLSHYDTNMPKSIRRSGGERNEQKDGNAERFYGSAGEEATLNS